MYAKTPSGDHRPANPKKLNVVVTEGDYWPGFYAARGLLKSREFNKVVVTVEDKHTEFSLTLKKEGAQVVQIDTLDRAQCEKLFSDAGATVMVVVPPPVPDMTTRVNNVLKAAKSHAELSCVLMWSRLAVKEADNIPDDEHNGKKIPNIITLYREIEVLVKNSGIEHGIIRVGFTVQTFFLMSHVIQNRGVFILPSSKAKVAPVNYNDAAHASALALCRGRLPKNIANKTVNFTGPELVTGPQMVENINLALNCDLKFEEVSIDEMRKVLSETPVPEFELDGLIAALRLFQNGKMQGYTDDLEEAMNGQKPSSIEHFFEHHKDAFQPVESKKKRSMAAFYDY